MANTASYTSAPGWREILRNPAQNLEWGKCVQTKAGEVLNEVRVFLWLEPTPSEADILFQKKAGAAVLGL